MFVKAAAVTALVALAAQDVVAWTNEGHELIGGLADQWITSNTQAAVDQLIPGKSLREVSTWADTIKRKYGWSSSLHYIDTDDNLPLDTSNSEPVKCSVQVVSDQDKGRNVVTAIANYTQVVSGPQFPQKDKSEGLMFLTHFIGDLAQPLHACGKLRGGNEFKAIWEGQSQYEYQGNSKDYQLHIIWDLNIIEKDVNENFGGDWKSYEKWIKDATDNGEFAQDKESWTACNTQSDPKKDSDACALEWAVDTNNLNCGVIWDKKLLSGDGKSTKNDLAKEYYQQTYMIARKQLAKGGYRLAKYLDIVLGKQNSGEPTGGSTQSLPKTKTRNPKPTRTPKPTRKPRPTKTSRPFPIVATPASLRARSIRR
ncbi:S1/P1 nuclease-domain-containing protein [Phlyctochytrium arcticum]|nr:S1/P1 nuclease-domain-containing protein [Phlyctochytrium arcticum]